MTREQILAALLADWPDADASGESVTILRQLREPLIVAGYITRGEDLTRKGEAFVARYANRSKP